MTTYAGIDDYPTSFTIPDDGNNKPVSSILPAIEALANRTTKLKKDLDGTHDGTVTLASPNFTGIAQGLGALHMRGATGIFALRPWVDTVTVNHTYSLLDGDLFFVPVVGGIVNPVFTIANGGSTNGGARMRWVYAGSGRISVLQRADTSNICVIGQGSTQYLWVELVTNGSANDWRICGGQVMP